MKLLRSALVVVAIVTLAACGSSERKKNRAEAAYAKGAIDARGLQSAYASALATSIPADAAAWRAEQLRRRPLAPQALEA